MNEVDVLPVYSTRPRPLTQILPEAAKLAVEATFSVKLVAAPPLGAGTVVPGSVDRIRRASGRRRLAEHGTEWAGPVSEPAL